MSLLDDMWAKGDREGVFQRVLPMLHEAPVLFGGPEALRRPFMAIVVPAWDAGLLPRGKAIRPLENALLFAIRDIYVAWASKLEVAAPAAGDESLTVSGVLDDAAPLHSALLRVLLVGTRFLSTEEVGALAAANDKPAGTVLARLTRGEESRRSASPDRAKAMDRFALARRTGKTAEELVGWAVAAREGLAVAPADIEAALEWPAGMAGKKIAEAREVVLKRLLQGKPVYEADAGGPTFETLSRYVDEDLPQAEADKVAEMIESSTAATRALGRIARLSALVADATLGSWEPAALPGANALAPADLAGWSAGGRADAEDRILSDATELARAVDVLRAIATKDGRTLPPVPADVVPKRTVSTPPGLAPVEDSAPKIRLKGWPGHLDIVSIPEGVKTDEDGHIKAFSWKAGDRDVMADISSAGNAVGVRIRVKSDGKPAVGVPCIVSGKSSRKSYSTRPTDTTGEAIARGMPLQSFSIAIDGVHMDVVIES